MNSFLQVSGTKKEMFEIAALSTKTAEDSIAKVQHPFHILIKIRPWEVQVADPRRIFF
jgi:hypothetical protein